MAPFSPAGPAPTTLALCRLQREARLTGRIAFAILLNLTRQRRVSGKFVITGCRCWILTARLEVCRMVRVLSKKGSFLQSVCDDARKLLPPLARSPSLPEGGLMLSRRYLLLERPCGLFSRPCGGDRAFSSLGAKTRHVMRFCGACGGLFKGM